MKALILVALTGLLGSAPAFAQKGQYADVNGIHLYYEIHGSGSTNGAKPLVLLHGGLCAIESFGPNLAALAQGREVIAVDLQGHGRTADIDRPFSTEAMGDDIAALLNHLKISKADIMGYSLGSGVAMQVAVRHPELVNKLVLASAIVRRSDFYPEILAQQAMVNDQAVAMMKNTQMYQLYVSLAPRPQDFGRLLNKLGDFMKKDFDYSEQLKQIKAPTLLIAGDADIFPVKYAARNFELLGGGQKDGGWDGSGRVASQLAVLPGVTHYAMSTTPLLAPTAIAFLDAPSQTQAVK